MSFKNTLSLLCLCSSLFFTLSGHAQEWRKEALTPNDQTFMEQQRNSIDELVRLNFGRQLSGKKSNDFPLLQRLLDEKLVTSDETTTLQAMGVILGDILKNEQGLSWTIYTDKYGRSRALSILGKPDVVFPITMISRRYETGAKVNIEEIYQKAVSSVETIKRQIIVH